MSDKVYFMPYDPNHPSFLPAQFEYGSAGGSDMNKLMKDVDHEESKGNVAIPVWYQPGRRSAFMMSLDRESVYVRGHGMAGFRSIEGGRGGERINYVTLSDRLIESGLPKSFSGKIKLFNCHSAESGLVGSDPECVGHPFARLVADEMYQRGYRACTFYGYVGRIDSFVKDGSNGKHHYIRDIVNGRMEEVGRASQGRIQFKPNPLPVYRPVATLEAKRSGGFFSRFRR